MHAGLAQAPVADSERRLGGCLQGGWAASRRVADLSTYAFAVGWLDSVSGQAPDAALGGGTEIGLAHQVQAVQWGVHARWLEFTPRYSRLRRGLTVDLPVSRQNALRGECSHETLNGDGASGWGLSFRHFFD